jgi:hypothetical protein
MAMSVSGRGRSAPCSRWMLNRDRIDLYDLNDATWTITTINERNDQYRTQTTKTRSGKTLTTIVSTRVFPPKSAEPIPSQVYFVLPSPSSSLSITLAPQSRGIFFTPKPTLPTGVTAHACWIPPYMNAAKMPSGRPPGFAAG